MVSLLANLVQRDDSLHVTILTTPAFSGRIQAELDKPWGELSGDTTHDTVHDSNHSAIPNGLTSDHTPHPKHNTIGGMDSTRRNGRLPRIRIKTVSKTGEQGDMWDPGSMNRQSAEFGELLSGVLEGLFENTSQSLIEDWGVPRVCIYDVSAGFILILILILTLSISNMHILVFDVTGTRPIEKVKRGR